MTNFGWDFPPGVTGNELEMAGPDREAESDEPCPDCGGPTMECSYQSRRWLACQNYDHTNDLESLEPDPDRLYDEERDRQMLEEVD